MSDGSLRAAIIGTGRIGSALERDPLRTKPHTHAGWYVSHPHILLSGGADTNPDRVAMAQAALRAGARGLWLQKAVATSMASARTLRATAAAAGASVVVNHPRAQDPHYRAVPRIIDDGTLGSSRASTCCSAAT
jgi:predicted dehydrogenase